MPSRDNRYKKKLYKPNMSDDSFDDHSITKHMFQYIKKVLPKGRTILELGSGWGTSQLIKHWTVYSVEHDSNWVGKYDSNYLYTPLKEHKPMKNHESTIWYDANILEQYLKDLHYDLLLVDGPVRTRSGFWKYMDMFNSKAIWIFDDYNRYADFRVVNSVAHRKEAPYTVYCCKDGKPFAVINDPLHDWNKYDSNTK